MSEQLNNPNNVGDSAPTGWEVLENIGSDERRQILNQATDEEKTAVANSQSETFPQIAPPEPLPKPSRGQSEEERDAWLKDVMEKSTASET